MMMAEEQQPMNKMALQRAVPGQGMNMDMKNPKAFEKPPEFTNYDKAVEYLFDKVTSNGPSLIKIIKQGVPISTLTEQMLTIGFAEGKWQANLMMLLIEPTMYMLMFICEMAQVDFVLDEDEEFDVSPRTDMKATNYTQSIFKKATNKVKEEVATKGEEASIQAALPESLLANPEMEMMQ